READDHVHRLLDGLRQRLGQTACAGGKNACRARKQVATMKHGRTPAFGYSLNSVFLGLALLLSVSASLRSCLRKAAKPAASVAAGTTACLSRKAMNFGSLNSFWSSLDS